MTDEIFLKAGDAFVRFCKVVAALRHPEAGCPWDLEQTHRSLRKYMLEEAYEAANEMTDPPSPALCEELGDVLLQVVLHSQLALETSSFDVTRVVEGIEAKMLRRHPHVFGSSEDRNNRDIASIKKRWQAIKAQEKQGSNRNGDDDSSMIPLGDLRKVLPATTQAEEIGNFTASINFDLSSAEHCLNLLEGEVAELREAIAAGNRRHTAEELGDVVFTLAQLSRHLGESLEVSALAANEKFLARLASVEKLLKREGIAMHEASRDQLEDAWSKVKKSLLV